MPETCPSTGYISLRRRGVSFKRGLRGTLLSVYFSTKALKTDAAGNHLSQRVWQFNQIGKVSESKGRTPGFKASSFFKTVILPIAVGAAGLISMSYVGYALQAGRLPLLTVSDFKLVNFTFTMQLYVLPLSFIGLLFLYIYDRRSFRTFFRFRLKGDPDLQSDWKTLGPAILVAFAVATSLFMALRVFANNGTVNQTFFGLLPLVVLFAFTNAWTEEILSRFVVVAGLHGKLQPVSICWVSAVVFGLPHLLASGIIGVLSSGLLGWFLAKSVIETKSLGWALLIHFLLDVIVFAAGAMIVAGAT